MKKTISLFTMLIVVLFTGISCEGNADPPDQFELADKIVLIDECEEIEKAEPDIQKPEVHPKHFNTIKSEISTTDNQSSGIYTFTPMREDNGMILFRPIPNEKVPLHDGYNTQGFVSLE